MKRAIVAVAVLTSSGVATAGGYAGLGIGPDVAIGDNPQGFTSGGRSARLLGGYSFSRFAVEASLTGQMIHATGLELDAKELSLSGKYNLPLGSNFEAFGRAGVHRTQVSSRSSALDISGNGLQIGGGFEYRIKAAIASGSLFVDYGLSKATLTGDGDGSVDLTMRQWMLGFTVGF